MEATKKALANRGKTAEKQVQTFLEKLSRDKAGFDFERQYDARSSRGRLPSQTGDYTFYVQSPKGSRLHGAIEVKEVEHDFRLPKKNFSEDQIARLRRRSWAGGYIVVIVKHTTTKVWRVPPFPWFDDNKSQPSWDLSEFPTYASAAAALESLDHDDDRFFN